MAGAGLKEATKAVKKGTGTQTKGNGLEARIQKDTKFETILANIKTEVTSSHSYLINIGSSGSNYDEEVHMYMPGNPKGAESEAGSDTRTISS